MPDVRRTAPYRRHTQSYIYELDKWSKSDSKKNVQNREGYTDGYDRDETYHRWRQYNPEQNRFDYTRQSMKQDGAFAIIGRPK